MSDVAATLSVDVTAKETVTAVLARLEAQLDRSDANAQRLAQALETKLARGQGAVRNETVQLLQAQARLAVVQGDLATAANLYGQALRTEGVGVREAIQLKTQLAQVERKLAEESQRAAEALTQAGTKMRGGSAAATEFTESLKSGLLGIVGPAAAAGVALEGARRVVESFGEAFKFKTELDATTASINSQLTGVRDVATVWEQARAAAATYRLTQADTNAILASSIDVLRNGTSSVADLEVALLRLQSRDPSKPISEAARALRELQAGDVVTIKDLFNIGAADALKMKNEIQGGADAVQVLTQFLDHAGSGMNILEQRTKGALGAMNDLKIAEEQVKLAEATLAQGPGITALTIKAQVLTGLARVLSGDLATGFEGAKNTLAGAIAQSDVYRESLARTGSSVTAFIDAWNTMQAAGPPVAAATDQAGNSAQTAAAGYDTAAQAALTAANAAAAATPANYQLASAYDAARAAALSTLSPQELAAASFHTSADAAQQDALQKQIDAAQTQILNQETLNMANAFIAANPHIDAAGVKAAVMAGALTPAQAAVVELTLKLQGLRAELAAISGKASGGGGPGLSASSFATSQEFFNKNQREAAAAAAAAQREQILATGSTAEKMALLNRELAEAKRRYGEGSAQAIRAQTAIDLAIDRSTKKSKGAGAAKLSDQAKLNNQLLSADERFQQQEEDAAREHTKNLLQIERDFQEQMAKAREKFAQDQFDDRASFYERLGGIEDQGLRQAMSAQYEAAAQEAAKIASEKGADAGDEFLKASREAIEKQAELQQKIKDARDKGDDGTAEYYEGVLRLQQQADERRLNQIRENGSAIANAHQEALDAEAQRYQEQQDKIGTASDRAADRLVTNAQRAGKAIATDLIPPLQDAAALVDRIGGPAAAGTGGAAPGGAAGAPAGGSAPAAPTTSAAPGAPTDLSSIVEALHEITAAVAAVEKATKEGSKSVVSAVQSSGTRRAYD